MAALRLCGQLGLPHFPEDNHLLGCLTNAVLPLPVAICFFSVAQLATYTEVCLEIISSKNIEVQFTYCIFNTFEVSSIPWFSEVVHHHK